jgi:Na+/pantothenate symporter
MNLSTNQRIIIITVFAAYTIFQLVYSLVTRKAMANGKGDYLSKFYTGGRSGGVLVTAMMVSAGVAGAGVFMGVPGYIWCDLDGLLFLVHVHELHGTWTGR